MYPRLFSQLFSWVYTFEPDALNFYCLSQNCDTDNVIKFNAALGKFYQMVSLNRPSMDNMGMHSIKDEPGTIPILLLNDFFPKECNLLQLDVEGYEPLVLDGGMEFIIRYEPVIALETVTQPMRDILNSIGYREVDKSVSDTIFVKD